LAKAVQLPFSFVILLILILIAAVVILLWHFKGFGLFEKSMSNVTCDFINNTTGIQAGCA